MPADLRQEMVRYSRRLHAAGWVANHDGNLSARLRPGRFLCTPTATSKADVDVAHLLEVDDAGKRVAGTARPFGEIGLHLAVYRRRPEVTAVVHAHPPHATALAVSGNNLIERPFIAEAIVSLGPRIPLVPFAAPGPAACEGLGGVAGEVDAALLGGHGVFTWGTSLEQAYLRMELVEHLARIAILAQAAGGVRPLPEGALAPLLESRAKAGLGPAPAPAPAPAKVVACAPAPHANVEVVPPGGDRTEVSRIIGEEIARALAKHRG